MTVHGAKGSRRRSVILSDTHHLPAGPPRRQPRLAWLAGAGAAPEPT